MDMANNKLSDDEDSYNISPSKTGSNSKNTLLLYLKNKEILGKFIIV